MNTAPREEPSVRFERCKREGVLEKVNAGERCTIEQAKALGIFDAKMHTSRAFPAVRTFNATVDQAQERGAHALCQAGAEGAVAHPFCVLEHGAGFRRKPGFPDTCIAAGCPTGFAAEGITGCKKPIQDAVVAKAARCDERPYDWFMVPNYHLGNGHKKVGNACYAPCPADQVPLYGTDPVDGSTSSFEAVDAPAKCTPKADYFGGKYADTSDFCPIAWVKRLSATPDRVAADGVRAAAAVKGTANGHRDALEKALAADAARISQAAHANLENVRPMPTPEAAQACATLATVERLKDTYATCELAKNEPRTIENMWGDDPPALRQKKTAVLRGACHALFCDQKENTAATLDKEPLCFEDVAELTDRELQEAAEAQSKKPPPPQPAPDSAEARARVGKALRIMLIIAVSSIALVIFLALWTEVFYPYVFWYPVHWLMSFLKWIGLPIRNIASRNEYMSYRRVELAERLIPR